jgi:predicted MFS family arabinose efflux permease
MPVPHAASPADPPAAGNETGRPRPSILTGPLLLMFAADFGALTSFFLLLPVVPLYAVSGGATRVGAGLATTALTFATVVGELATPRLVGRFGYRQAFGAGLLLLAAPALAMAASASILVIILGCIVRGFGFALTAVAGSAIIASLIPRERRGEGLGLYGVSAGVPSVVALPLGVWLAGHVGYPPVFIIGAVAALTGFAALPILPGRRATPPDMAGQEAGPGQEPGSGEVPGSGDVPGLGREPEPGARQSGGVLNGLRTPALVLPATIFAVTAMAAGATFTFLPLALTGASRSLVPVALLVQPAAAAIARWQAGRYGDRHDAARLLIPGVAAVAAGMIGVALALAAIPAVLIAAMVLFGVGFGIVQNASLAVMYSRMPISEYGTVSAMWNVAYDIGLGLGATGFGVLAARSGYLVAFDVTAALMLAALAPAWRDRATR